MRLDATAHADGVQVDFPNVPVEQNMVGNLAQATVGGNSTASLTLTLGVGDIKMYQALEQRNIESQRKRKKEVLS